MLRALLQIWSARRAVYRYGTDRDRSPGCLGCIVLITGALFLTVVLGVGGAIFTVYYVVYIEPNWVRTEKVIIKHKELGSVLAGMKVVQLSDLHVIDKARKLEGNMIRVVNSINPDIIFLTGDFITDSRGFNRCIDTLSQLKANIGIWAILGNCDTCVYKKIWKRELQRVGINLLDDSKTCININGKQLWVIGLNDHSRISKYLYILAHDIKPDSAVILLNHSPEHIEEASMFNIDLMLSGDTHGAQCGVRWLRQFTGWKSIYLSGLYKVDNTYLYVNRGLGWHHKPARLLCWPEVTLFTFVTEGEGSMVKKPEPERRKLTQIHKTIRKIWDSIDTTAISELIRRDVE